MLLKQSEAQSTPQVGFTVIENTIIVLVIGILGAIATPSMLNWFNNRKVDNVLVQVEAALREAQAAARQQSRICKVSLGTDTITATWTEIDTDDNCFPSGPKNLSSLGVGTNNDARIQWVTTLDPIHFSARGNTINEGLIVIYRHRNPANLTANGVKARCLIISNGIGLMRVGTYTQTTDLVTTTVNPQTLDINACESDG